MSRTGPRLGAPVRHPGADAAVILERIGARTTVAELEQAGVLRVAGVPPAAW